MTSQTSFDTINSQSPVLFLVFNRPKTTERVFNAIRTARPPRLYVAADGARDNKPQESILVSQVQKIATNVDWPCEVFTLFRTTNIGCKTAVSEAISWFFSKEKCGIILEDDCLPHPDFFPYCDSMLERFEQNDKVLTVTGNNFQRGLVRGDASYYFSKYCHCWGWATWRSAWELYSGDIEFLENWKESSNWKEINPNPSERHYWGNIFKSVQSDKLDTWDYSWLASVWHGGGLTVTPNVNLVTNIGFGRDATHTKFRFHRTKEIARNALGPMIHNDNVVQNVPADTFVFDHVFNGKYMRWPWLPIYRLAKTFQRNMNDAVNFLKKRKSRS